MFMKKPDYYDNINATLLDSIPTAARVILEIGCGTGCLGAAFKARHEDCAYYGVEIDPAAAAAAAGRLDLVLCGAAENMDLSFLHGTVDCLVYGDVLEHLVDPWSLLAAHVRLLASGGKVVACIPNVQNWSLLEHLLQGNWTYHDHGILDDTHLRFFTLASMARLFEQAGLRVDSSVGLVPSAERAAAFFEAIRPALPALRIDEAGFQQMIGPLQYVLTGSVVDTQRA